MKTELEQFEKYASDTYESIARYETLPTRPYKSLEVKAAHDAWMARAELDLVKRIQNLENAILEFKNTDHEIGQMSKEDQGSEKTAAQQVGAYYKLISMVD